MKALKSIAVLLFAFCFMSFMQVDPPADPVGIKVTWHLIVALLAGIYEVVVRLIPTIGNYSWIAKAIEILLWISNFLNRKKK